VWRMSELAALTAGRKQEKAIVCEP
jgi:hypothetical protein